MPPSLDSKLDHKDYSDIESKVPDVAYGLDGEPSHNIEDYYRFDPKVERRVVRKLDTRLMPLIFCMYVFNAIDRSNLGNAKTDGLESDLHFHGNDYSIMLSLFYIPFCTLTIPAIALSKKIGAKVALPLYMFTFGGICMANAAVKNFAGFLMVRLFLGAAESGFAVTIVWYLTTFYTRGELGKRVAMFYSALAFAGGFSGLIAYGVFQPDIRLYGWQLLFLVEGAGTVFFSILAIFILPANIDSTPFFSSEEKHVARIRILRDSSAVINPKFTSQAFFAPLKDWKLYVWALIAIGYGVSAVSTGIFLPQIIGRMGKSELTTNLLTVAPNFVGGFGMLLTAASSDYFRERSLHMAGAMTVTMIGFIILYVVDVSNTGIQYFGSFLLCLGAFTPSAMFQSWHNCNDASEVGRGFRTALMAFFVNSSGLIASNIFTAKEEPYYNTALVVNFSFLAVGISIVLSLRTYMMVDNRRRNTAQGVNWSSKDVPTAALAVGVASPEFRHFL
ncbi:major facilitator superfamily domain-containing protein [Desarmillaria tabescens]|uniref:Major facilitator superfamily domain-containing protein n=1 Tax=Armillaria tabescens TaxID=1929756 RepID=A0AA39N7G3_ARMTA|nr:major facilitator superfamily domain-containing protein [Desarmillaria tabescens]KAK0460431.1 major facilitator superfamily domain-containing protein [Desarmillaria tabescens]